jgi:hypothetical protein
MGADRFDPELWRDIGGNRMKSRSPARNHREYRPRDLHVYRSLFSRPGIRWSALSGTLAVSMVT